MDTAQNPALGREEQAAFIDSLQRLIERHVAPIAAEIDETDRFPRELVEVFGDAGLLQQWVPEAYGGPGGNLTSLCTAKLEIAKVSFACSLFAGQNSLGMILPLLHFGSEEQRQRFLPMVAKGRTLTATAITEPHAGSDVSAMRTRAVRDGSSYLINGQKCFITFGSVADWILVFARTSEGKGASGISAFLVDTKTPGFKVGRNERKMGVGGLPNVQLFFEDMRVPAENRIGEEGEGFKASMRGLDLNRPTVAAAAIGIAQGALDYAIGYAKERHAFGKPIASFQGLQWMLADMSVQLNAARLCIRSAAASANPFPDPLLAAQAKIFASEMALKVTSDALQIFGARGYSRNNPMERMMRDARMFTIGGGTAQVLRNQVASRLLGWKLPQARDGYATTPNGIAAE
jgi:alkylation response protein AidB-like acyl-CoA dehydrogenase